MKEYIGTRLGDGQLAVIVSRDGELGDDLPLRLDLVNHSPSGFECGYGGSGPAQLALAILADLLGDDDQAIRLHQGFKAKRIAKLPRAQDWRLKETEILAILADLYE